METKETELYQKFIKKMTTNKTNSISKKIEIYSNHQTELQNEINQMKKNIKDKQKHIKMFQFEISKLSTKGWKKFQS